MELDPACAEPQTVEELGDQPMDVAPEEPMCAEEPDEATMQVDLTIMAMLDPNTDPEEEIGFQQNVIADEWEAEQHTQMCGPLTSMLQSWPS